MKNCFYIYSIYDKQKWHKLFEDTKFQNKETEYENEFKEDFGKINIFSNAKNFRQKYLLRYYIIKYSLMHNNSFSFTKPNELNINKKPNLNELNKKIVISGNEEMNFSKSSYIVYSIRSILETTHSVTILGMLINNDRKELLLEDPTYQIKLNLDIDKVFFGKGIYCINHILLVHGKMNQLTQTFNVEFIFHPPFQTICKNVSKSILEEAYLLTYSSSLTNKKNSFFSKPTFQVPINRKYCELEPNNLSVIDDEIESWIILSDVLLTNKNLLNNLKKVFSGYENAIEKSGTKLGFILLGDFSVTENQQFKSKILCETNNFGNLNSYKNGEKTDFQEPEVDKQTNFLLKFDKTRQIFVEFGIFLEKFPILLKNCIFLLIPGSGDIGPDLIPKNPLTDYFTANLRNKFPNSKIYFKSNPTKIENDQISIVLMRYSLSAQLKEKTLYSYFGEKDMGHSKPWNMLPDTLENLIPPTILGQKHLTSTSSNIIPTLDPYLFLLPTPNVIVIGDSSPSFSVKPLENTWIVNPGSFKNTNSWIQYNLKNNSIDHVWL